LLDVILILVGLVILPVSYTLFTLAYAMYGSILYLVGPFVLALWPSRAMGQVSRTYFVNLMIFQSWGLLYAILQVLITALQMNSVNSVLNGNGVLNAFVGSSQMVLLGAVSLLFSIAIILIPFIASRLVRGDVGGTVFALLSAIGFYAGATAKLLLGSTASSQPLPAGPPPSMSEPGPPTGSGPGSIGASAGANAGSGGGLLSESRAPTPLSASSGANAAGSAGEIGAGGAVVAV
jgi:hypothetical protein